MGQYCEAEWHFTHGHRKCLLRLNVAGSNLVTSGQHCLLLQGQSDEDLDDLDNFGWYEMSRTIGWLSSKCRGLLSEGWMLERTAGKAMDHSIGAIPFEHADLAPWHVGGDLGPAVI